MKKNALMFATIVGTSALAANPSWNSRLQLTRTNASNKTAADAPAPPAPASAQAQINDQAQIYGAFLDRWAGSRRIPINLSTKVLPPSTEDLTNFSDCAKERNIGVAAWMPADPVADLRKIVGNLSYVRLVDPADWQPLQQIQAPGQTIESAIVNAEAHALMTLSAITFDERRTTAAFKYSFTCGARCGNRGVIIFRKAQTHWVRIKDACDILLPLLD
jgi:hypothetical protein